MSRISTSAELTWRSDLVFDGTAGGTHAVLDSNGKAGPSPMQLLAMGLAGCMSMDVVDILKKGRYDMRALRAHFIGHRAGEPPKRYEEITLHFVIDGNPPAEAVDRAIALSRNKYCSVWHSMRQDIELTVTYEIRTQE
jgi:putative redox protein